MCGIVGVCLKSPSAGDQVDRRLIEAMCGRIVHRGPDDQGIFLDGGIGLGMRRLSILDVEGGAQPMFSGDSQVAIVHNGEIYNFRSLRADLERRGHRFTTDCDTEVILHLYEEYGLDFVDHLNGMFATAVWDGRLRRLVLVRDRLGQKPLYYAETDRSLVFGSELKTVMTCPDIERRLSPEAVYHYFTLGVVPHPSTIYQGIAQLPPGHRLVFENNSSRIEAYWKLDTTVDLATDEQEARERLRELMVDAVRLRMISDVPLGAFLSGGLDSSTITILAVYQVSE